MSEFAERALLGAMLQGDPHPSCWDVEPEDFRDQRHASVFLAMMDLHQNGIEPSLLECHRLLEEWRDGDELVQASYLAELEWAGVRVNAPVWAERVIEASRSRQTKRALQEAIARTEGTDRESILAGVMDSVAKIPQPRDRNPTVSVKHAVKEAFAAMERRHQGVDISGRVTGIEPLDTALGGIRDAELVIIAGRPSMGKSALMGELMLGLARDRPGEQYLCASLEMTTIALVNRMLANASGVDLRRILKVPGGSDWPKLANAAGQLAQLPIHIIDRPGLTVGDIHREARRLGNIGAVFVDYLQIAKPSHKHENRHLELGSVGKELKALAKTLDRPVIALSQLNRQVESRKPPRPKLSDLRESGSLEEDADVVILLYREEYYEPETERPGIVEVIIPKNRNYGTGRVELSWDGPTQRFRDLEKKS